MTTNLTTMTQIDFDGPSPICRAAQCYKQWKSDVPFLGDLLDYLDHGIVIARPDIFGMAKIIDLRPTDANGTPIGERPEPAWFVRIAVGDLRTLVAELPCHFPKIVFCRRNNGRARVWPFDRFMHLATGGVYGRVTKRSAT